MEQTPVQSTPEEIASAQPVDQQPVQLTPEEISSAKPVDQQPVDVLKDFTTDQLVALQKQDPTFRLADQFRARPDIRKDPNRVQVIADALHQSRQTPLFEGLAQKYQGDSGVGTAWNVAKAGLGVAEDVVKGFGKQIWNY